MLERSRNKETIKQRKKREYLEALKEKEEKPLKKKFKAKPVPNSSKTPMFHNIMQDKYERSRNNKAMAREKLKASEKPFSFYESDKANYENKYFHEEDVNPECRIEFKANNIPEFYMEPDDLEHKEQKMEEEKLKAKELRKLKLLEQSKMPSRMQQDV